MSLMTRGEAMTKLETVTAERDELLAALKRRLKRCTTCAGYASDGFDEFRCTECKADSALITRIEGKTFATD